MTRLLTGAAVATAALAWVALGSAAVITRTAVTASYKLKLSVGPSEAMYTAAEARATRPRTGEVMMGDGMSTGGHAMSMEGGITRHLEVHVVLRSNGKVVTNVVPRITLTDTSSKAMTPVALDVMAMGGIGGGISDFHYGNNVALTINHVYGVLVTVKGERSHFTFRAS
jgi:hypothetical protein